jgi:hypothetical protein
LRGGSGKTTLAAGLASDLGVPHVELDGLYHGPGWTPADPDMFRARVCLATAEPAWVIDGNYTSIVGQILRDRARLVIALDLPGGVSWPGSPAGRSHGLISTANVVRPTTPRGSCCAAIANCKP